MTSLCSSSRKIAFSSLPNLFIYEGKRALGQFLNHVDDLVIDLVKIGFHNESAYKVKRVSAEVAKKGDRL